ncbi:zincin-like metallopeptidase domain-containing protein [Bradyrhizobium sp. Ai1a-2]|uniref:ArdC family protein n=1 Tax=Bradyrhizobium sp. Ai1a-2 TaxID=196490 RepID=UPI000415CCD1|nr:zincin-like metallopeptidase domain-containing protein [Bradyrhizobium sp. Ai1a-2]
MPKRSSDNNATKPKASLYEEITAHIIADLEAGVFPWARPWGSGGGNQAFALPRNAATGKAYSGINVLILWGRLFECGFASQRWLTFRQASSLGGTVRKGEHGVTVCYADRFVPKREQGGATSASHDQPANEEASVPFLRRYTVFNVDQCDNLPDHCIVARPRLPEREIVPQAEALAAATLADVRIGGAKAFYQPSDDTVHIPPQPAFFDQINYYRTLFHELGHWTGHPRRLNRDLCGNFGSKPYAHEELVAELTAAFVCAVLSIRPSVRHADYLGSWLKVLREDNRAIFRAASKASKAADFLLAFGGDISAAAHEHEAELPRLDDQHTPMPAGEMRTAG